MTSEELLAQPAADYMNEVQREFFRRLLLTQRGDLQRLIDEQVEDLRGLDTHGDRPMSAMPSGNASGNCASWNGKRSCWTRSTKPWSAWPATTTAGARRPANP